MSRDCCTKAVCPCCGKSRSRQRQSASASPICRSNSSHSGRSKRVLTRAPSSTSLGSIRPSQSPSLKDYGISNSFLRHPRYRGTNFNIAYPRKNLNGKMEVMGVLKWISRNHRCDDDDHLDSIMEAVNKAIDVVDNFQKLEDMKGWKIAVSKPKLLRVERNHAYYPKEGVVLLDRYLPNFQKFNFSGTGWASSSNRTYNKVLQRLSHFSYTSSNKQYLLCDFQGQIDERGKTILLSCPTILTRQGGKFGCMDMGYPAIQKFFKNHDCHSMCSSLTKRHAPNISYDHERYSCCM